PTTSGVHWFLVEDVVEGKPKPYSEVQPEIEERIQEEYNRAELDSFLGRLKQKKRIAIYLPNFQEPRGEKDEEKAPGKPEKGGKSERSPEKATEKKAAEKATERVTEKAVEKTPDKTPEKTAEKSPEKSPEKNTEKTPEKTPDKAEQTPSSAPP